jgi:uncharacterized protein YjiS (DUF1127 family)
MQANACIFSIKMGMFCASKTQRLRKMKLHETVRKFFRERKAAAELHALDDRTLSDIGVSRSHISAAVKGRF